MGNQCQIKEKVPCQWQGCGRKHNSLYAAALEETLCQSLFFQNYESFHVGLQRTTQV